MEAELIPVSEELLERVRTGKELCDVGRIDLRDRDHLTVADLRRQRYEHCDEHRYGREAPIRLTEPQMRGLALEAGMGVDSEGHIIDPYTKKRLDLTAPGSKFMGHEVWVEPDAE